ncbi:MAG: FliO/MopB family protein [Candidatus Riflebacteria bacterium]|nr:FliO/MopB family protein [Candidatus Riflebacteria bacterium]
MRFFSISGIFFSLFFAFASAESFAAETVSSASLIAPPYPGAYIVGSQPASSTPAIATADLLFPPNEVATSPGAMLSDPFSIVLRLITSLAIVIGLVFALAWLLQKRGGLYRSVFGRTLGILPLDNRRFIYLVDVMGRILVLGVTEQQINLLCEISDKATIDALRIQTNTTATPGLERLFGFLRRGGQMGPEDSTDESEVGTSNFSAHTQNAQAQIRQVEKLMFQRRQEVDEHQANPVITPNSSAPSTSKTQSPTSEVQRPPMPRPERPFRGPE